MTLPNEVVFLFDVDNTLLDNDRVENDLRRHIEREFGAGRRDRYFAILEELRAELAMRTTWRFTALPPGGPVRSATADDVIVLVDYPFANRCTLVRSMPLSTFVSGEKRLSCPMAT